VNGVLYTFTSMGETVFYCAAGGGNHCNAGQIVKFNVVNPDDATESPSSAPTINRIIQYAGNPCHGLSGERGDCIACTGDCDKDSDCLGELRCAQRRRWDGLEEVPGCSFLSGDPFKTTDNDFCFEPQIVDAGVANYIGECGTDNGYLCGECEGHCSTSYDCKSGLICKSRSGFETVAGCIGGQASDMYGRKICVRPPTTSPSPSFAPSQSHTPTANPTPQSYLACRTRKVNRKRKLCIKTPGCRWVTGVPRNQRCQPITPAPTSRPSRSPTSKPSSSPTADVIHSVAKSDLVVTCPITKSELEEMLSSDLIVELQTNEISVDVTVTILSDVSCSIDAGRRLEHLNVEALIESTVVLHGSSISYTPSMLIDAATNSKSDVYTVSNTELIESPSAAASMSPSLSTSITSSEIPSEVPTVSLSPTPQSYLACRTRKANKRRKVCIRTPGCRWGTGVHWTQRCQPIIT